jgi:hypothetical protein
MENRLQSELRRAARACDRLARCAGEKGHKGRTESPSRPMPPSLGTAGAPAKLLRKP